MLSQPRAKQNIIKFLIRPGKKLPKIEGKNIWIEKSREKFNSIE